MADAKDRIAELIDAKRDEFIEAADSIWMTPELEFENPRSVRTLERVLDREGFEIEQGLAGMDCAFRATYGSGDPIVGILAEFDALADMSQVADLGEQKPVEPGAPGHACGHNLLGAAAIAAAVGLGDFLDESDVPGTIILFGCPAEESGDGKAFMAREGIFDQLDAAFTWHPWNENGAWSMSSLAVIQSYFSFRGISAHAAAAPWQGRSALDAAELMNVGVQFLREHIVEGARVHYAFVDAGGSQANVVQSSARLMYYVRAPEIEQAQEIYGRVGDIARGAALMTGTKVEEEFYAACRNYLPNHALTEAMYENMKRYGRLGLTDADQDYARRYRETLSAEVRRDLIGRARGNDPDLSAHEARRLGELPVSTQLKPLAYTDEIIGTTDVGDVSWIVPTAQALVACEPAGVAAHTWQWAANGTSSIAHKGLLAAARIIATSAYDALTDPDLLRQAKAEHDRTMEGTSRKSVIPEDVKPK